MKKCFKKSILKKTHISDDYTHIRTDSDNCQYMPKALGEKPVKRNTGFT